MSLQKRADGKIKKIKKQIENVEENTTQSYLK